MMRASLSFELSRQAAPLVPQQQQHSPSGSSDSGYKSESSTDGAKSYVSQDSQDLFAYKSTYRRDSTGPTSHQAQGPKLQDFGELQQSAELRCLQASSQIVLGGGETHTKDVSLPTFEKAIPLDLRQNPRRSGQSRDTTQTAASQPPCTLRRGAVKRDCFVTRLVSTYKCISSTMDIPLIKHKLSLPNWLVQSGQMQTILHEMIPVWGARASFP